MGLDVTAYKGLRKVGAEMGVRVVDGEAVDVVTGEWREDCLVFHANPSFLRREGSISSGIAYTCEDSKGLVSMGYGRYGMWRESLAQLAGYPETENRFGRRCSQSAWDGKCEGMPFVELVNFSDAEGVLGPEVCAKLAKDFADFDDRAKEQGEEFFYQHFREWREAFEMGAQNGAVVLH